MEFEDDGKIVENAKSKVLDNNIFKQLLELEMNYFFMIDLINNAESVNYTVEKAIKILEK
jgi:hypothetical protein